MELTDFEKKIIEENRDKDVRDLALKLHNKNINTTTVLQQIAGWQIAKHKIPDWANNKDVLYPVHLSMEQCSSDFTAKYKAEVVTKLVKCQKKMADLTGGFGIDFYYISQNFEKATYIETNSELCEIAEHNFKVLGRTNAVVKNGNGINILEKSDEHLDLIFVDPARRDKDGGKTVHIKDCEPDVTEYQEMLKEKADIVMIKLSPMLDLKECRQELKNIREIHVVANNNECKEMLLILDKNFDDEPNIFCVNNNQKLNFKTSEESSATACYADKINNGMFLYEPNSAIMKGGAYKLLCNKYDVKKLQQSSHLYVSETEINDFPGRKFVIEEIGNVKIFKGLDKANVAVRNFPIKAEELKKKLKLKDGGDIYLFGTTLKDNQKVIIKTRKI